MGFNISEISPKGSRLANSEGSVNVSTMDIKNKFIHRNGLGYVIRESVILISDTDWTERKTSAYKLSFSVFSLLRPGFEAFWILLQRREDFSTINTDLKILERLIRYP